MYPEKIISSWLYREALLVEMCTLTYSIMLGEDRVKSTLHCSALMNDCSHRNDGDL